MSTPVEPLRLLLLADEPQWAALLHACMPALNGSAVLLTAPDWDSVDSLFSHDRQAVVLATPALQPVPGRCELPTILLLDHEPEVAPSAVSDWLVRDQLNADTLRRSLRHVRERGVLVATLQRLAEQDPLTGIANRQGFQALLTARLAENEGRGIALGHLDLDNFRHVNDALGHQSGDRLILQVVARLQNQLEAGDQLARLGSDEFALLIDTRRDANRAEWIAERIVEALAEPYWIDGESLLLGCSLGLAHARAQSGADPLMWHAHIAMRQAK
ncbi:MAG: diguanylate cyclase domain-containing protein, partial [Pseudomonas putida]